jgi:NADH-quinone oxidoreductase subunit G
MAERVTITIDGRAVEAAPGELLIAVAQRAGTYLPRFCWHPRLEPVGMCRQCLVEIEGPRGRALTTSCTTRVAEGMVVHTTSEVVRKAREGVLEYLLINHPLDCPVCDRGGECPLQDQTVAFGPGESRYVEEKRHFAKPIPISDLVLLDRERCILCARCTRFAEEIAGDPLIHFVSRGNTTQVLTFPGEPFSSYFSGNTVQICPVGALTASPYRFRARPWDLEAVESTCPHCSVGCRVSLQASANRVVRLLGVDNAHTNQGWLCDKGRFGFEYLASPERLTTPLVRGKDGELHPATWAEALGRAAAGLRSVIDGEGADAVAGLGGARSTNEEAYAFGKFLRATVGTGHLDARLGDALSARFLTGLPRRGAIDDLEEAGAVLVWGPDLKEELPVLYLRVRRAATRRGARLVVVHPRATGLDPVADHVLRYRPGEGAEMLRRLSEGEGEAAAARAALEQGPLVAVVGRPGLAEDPRLAEAVAAFAEGFPGARVLPVARRSNLYGALDMGLAPDLLPGRVPAGDLSAREALAERWGGLPGAEGEGAEGIVAGLQEGRIRAVVLLGCDPAADFPDPARAAAALERAELVVAVDLFLTASSRRAHLVFTALAFGEVEGTVTNLEGRVQKVNRLVPGPGQARPAVEIIEDLARLLGHSIGAETAASLAEEIAATPAYAGITWASLARGDGRDGIRAATPAPYDLPLEAPEEGSGELVLHLARVLYDRGTAVQRGPALAGLAPAPSRCLHPADAARLGAAEGGTVRLVGSSGAIELPAVLDASLAPGTVYLPANLGASVGSGRRVGVEVVR